MVVKYAGPKVYRLNHSQHRAHSCGCGSITIVTSRNFSSSQTETLELSFKILSFDRFLLKIRVISWGNKGMWDSGGLLLVRRRRRREASSGGCGGPSALGASRRTWRRLAGRLREGDQGTEHSWASPLLPRDFCRGFRGDVFPGVRLGLINPACQTPVGGGGGTEGPGQ